MIPDEKAVYKGRRKRLNVIAIVLFIVVLLSVLAFLTFYSFQKYIVYGHDGIEFELPILAEPVYTDAGGGKTEFAPVEAQLSIKDPDYTAVAAIAGEGVGPINALYVPKEFMTAEGLEKYKSIMSMYGATGLILDVKPDNGYLLWPSVAEVSASYNTGGTYDLASVVKSLVDSGIYVAARLSCCLDSLLAERGSTHALKNASGGTLSTPDGMWLDPYSPLVRSYIIQLCEELAAMGVNEVFLDNLCVPATESGVVYSVSLSSTPSPIAAVCSFAKDVSRSLRASNPNLLVSVILSNETMHGSGAATTGQHLPLFAKVFDHLCCETTNAWQYGYDRDSVAPSMELGNAADRYPALMVFFPEEATSWIILVPEVLTKEE